jgi:hypothetical protein
VAAAGSGCGLSAVSPVLTLRHTPTSAPNSPPATASAPNSPAATATPTPATGATPGLSLSWSAVTSPTAPGQVSGLAGVTCVGADDCWAVGFSGTLDAVNPLGEIDSTLIEHDAGNGWSIVPSPNPPGSQGAKLSGGVCASADDCWAVGDYFTDNTTMYTEPLIEQDTGGGWSIVSGPSPAGSQESALQGVACAGTDDCWAVGDYSDNTADGSSAALIEEDAGSGWSIVPSTSPSGDAPGGLSDVTCVGASDCWAAGYANSTDPGNAGENVPLVAQNTGSGWNIVSSAAPSPGGTVYGLESVVCADAHDCWAVGDYIAGGNDDTLPLIEQDAGSGWVIASSPSLADTTSNDLASVVCAGAEDCWAVGNSWGAAGQTILIEQDAGSGWGIVSSARPPGSAESTLASVTCPNADECWAVGTVSQTAEQTLIEQGT